MKVGQILMAHTFIPSIQEVETSDLQVWGQSVLQGEGEVQKKKQVFHCQKRTSHNSNLNEIY